MRPEPAIAPGTRYPGAVQRVCTIYFRHGARLYGHVTMADTLYGAIRNAWTWFHRPGWYGARPTPDTMFRVVLTGDSRQIYVRGDRALESRHDRPAQP